MHKILTASLLIAASLMTLACEKKDQKTEQSQDLTLTLYSSRNEQLIQPILDLYTQETGVKFQLITGKDGALIEKLKAEGKRSPADLLLTVDAGNLWYAASEQLLAPVESPILEAAIPSYLQDDSNRWFGFSLRARTIVYHPDRIQASELSTYQDLGSPKFKGRLVLRSSQKVYNQSLVAMFIERFGADSAQKVVQNWVANLAIAPTSNDDEVMEALQAGKGDVGIVNTYYYGRLKAKDSSLKLKLFWPNQSGTDSTDGVHINVSGMGIVASSSQAAAAQKFLEWLVSPKVQEQFAALNQEFPVISGIAKDPEVASWGEFRASQTPMSVYGQRQAEATRLMQSAGYQ